MKSNNKISIADTIVSSNRHYLIQTIFVYSIKKVIFFQNVVYER